MRAIAGGDLEHVLAETKGLWEGLRGARIFITGGTGFFGCWLLESFLHANRELGLKAEALVLTRDEEAFRRRRPHLAGSKALSFHRGDVRSFEFPKGRYSHIIHAATESSVKLNQEEPDLMLDAIVQGTRHALEFAESCGAKKFLFTSSGAVYGKQPAGMTRIPEDYVAVPDPAAPASAYAEGKREAELLCAAESSRCGIETKIARGFAFVGPGLPLDAHFAIGNFIRDALKGRAIEVRGDGTPYRSYLYAADLAVWLWTILLRGESCRPYNVGSERRVSILELARIVGRVLKPDISVHVQETPIEGKPPEQYVPSTQRARTELGLCETMSLEEAIRRTADWVLSNP
ncbi:MAG: NAD(P)-dependent oxidoreductase [Elusimicrobia bacterium]|nr:NAD(P)-dependent oxidoreductase [Elusimicrobiota bacterium]